MLALLKRYLVSPLVDLIIICLLPGVILRYVTSRLQISSGKFSRILRSWMPSVPHKSSSVYELGVSVHGVYLRNEVF